MTALEVVDASAVSVAVATPSLLGESPVWHPQEQCLYWCDIPGQRLNRFDPATGQQAHWGFPTEVASCALMQGGALLLALRDGLWRFEPRSGERQCLVAAPYDTACERFNDGKCDPQGRFWVGTLYEPRHSPNAALYCYMQGQLTRRAGGVTVSNGLAWSPDGRILYWTDTTAHAIYAVAVDPLTGTLGARRTFAQFDLKTEGAALGAYGGRPDGAAVDIDGCYWVAMFEGGRLLRLSPGGEILNELCLPVRCPTMPCFGGADLRTLYVTTARKGRPADELAAQPWAGCVLQVRVDTPGQPVGLFAG